MRVLRRRVLRAAWIVAIWLLCSCDGRGVEVAPVSSAAKQRARAAELFEPYRGRFLKFDRWARRTVSAEASMRGRSLEATLFAPLRSASGVLSAEVTRVATTPEVFGLNTERFHRAPPLNGFRDSHVGPLELGVGSCEGPGAPREDCVVISRSAPLDHTEVRVRMAFRHP